MIVLIKIILSFCFLFLMSLLISFFWKIMINYYIFIMNDVLKFDMRVNIF